MVFDFDDFGANHVISDQCQSHDCRDKLDELHYLNPNFKVTLFAIPYEMTPELYDWCEANKGWVELAVHGYSHSSNWEFSEITYKEMEELMNKVPIKYYASIFKAPGWQISDDAFKWLKDSGWWVADQHYNLERRPDMLAYVNDNGNFFAYKPTGIEEVDAWHGHTWNCVGNGIYETFEELKKKVVATQDFKFISEVLYA